MDNERRRFIKGGIANGLLIGSGALFLEGIRNLILSKEKEDEQKLKAIRQIVEKGKTFDMQTLKSEIKKIHAEEGDPFIQGGAGLGQISFGLGTATAGSLLVRELAETKNTQTPSSSDVEQ